MPVLRAHYRVALGEYNHDHSWIVQSNRGLIWMNIPDDLSSLLSGVLSENVLDFSLGSAGRYYIKYIAGGQERKLSRGLWAEINQSHNLELDRLTLGEDGQHWGVRVDRDGRCRSFDQVDDYRSFGHRLDSRIDGVYSFDEIDFVALGAGGDWAFGVNGRVEHRGSNSFGNCVSEGRRSGRKILSAAMSPLDRFWFLCWDDGWIDYHLPSDMADYVDAYCQLQHSMMYTHIAGPPVGGISLPIGDVSTSTASRAMRRRARLRRNLIIAVALVIIIVIVIGIVAFTHVIELNTVVGTTEQNGQSPDEHAVNNSV